jgi:hypothetical protein
MDLVFYFYVNGYSLFWPNFNGCVLFFSFLDGSFLDIQREEKTVQKAIRDAAKRNDMVSAKVLLLLSNKFLFIDQFAKHSLEFSTFIYLFDKVRIFIGVFFD